MREPKKELQGGYLRARQLEAGHSYHKLGENHRMLC